MTERLSKTQTTSQQNDAKLESVIIVDAKNLADTDFACWTSIHNREVFMMTPQYDEEQQSLTLEPKEAIKVEHLHNIHYGSSVKGDVDLCYSSHNTRYFVNVTGVSLNSHNVSLNLVTNSSYPNLTLTISVKQGEVINIHWKYPNYTDGKYKLPFEVPQDIVNTTSLPDCYSCKLADYVTIVNWENNTVGNSSCMIHFSRMNNGVRVPIFEIQDIILNDNLNVFRTGVYTHYQGGYARRIMGLSEQVSNELFLNDGVYSLWNRDAADPPQTGTLPAQNMYGSHPFYMFQ